MGATTHPDFVPGVVTAMRTSAQINDAMEQVHTSTAYQENLTRYLGADHPHLQLLAELAPAIVVHRTIFGSDLDPASFSSDVLALVQAVVDTPTTHPNNHTLPDRPISAAHMGGVVSVRARACRQDRWPLVAGPDGAYV